MTATTSLPRLADPRPRAARATQRRRRLRLARTLAGVSVRSALLPRGATRSRQRLQVCRAADILTALDVRVRVVGAAVPWPRLGRVVVSDHTGWLGDLALSTAVPGTPVLGRDVARVLPVGSVACPVVLRYRTAAGYLSAGDIPRTLADITAAQDLVVEVHRLPATPSPAAPPPAPPQDDMIEQLRKLGELRDAGIVTEEEFTAQKVEIVGA
jgi:hypothetical protein